MSVLLDMQLQRLVSDFDALIIKCELMHLPEVSKRLAPIRDVIVQGIELRKLVAEATPPTERPS